MTQSIAWKTGPSFSLRGLLCEWSQNDLRRQCLCSFIFFNTSPSSGKNLRARSREKKPVELNQTALLVGDIYSDLRVDLAMTGAINVRFFFGPFYKRVARGAFSLTLTCRTILPLSFGGDFQCIHVYPSSWARLEFVQWSSSRRSFAKMLWRTSPKQSRDNRRQQVTVLTFRAKMWRSSDSIAEETDSSPDPEEERQQHSCSLLSISLTSEFAHTALSQLFFLRQEVPRERNFPRFDWPLNACVGFWRLEPELSQTSQNASMRRCHPPPFFYSTSP